MNINHLTLSTGHLSHIKQGDVDDDIVAILSPWLEALIYSGPNGSAPVPGLEDYTAWASMNEGSLVVTIFGPMLPGSTEDDLIPLVTMGVAERTHDGDTLWPLLVAEASVGRPIKSGLQRPAEPWCAVNLHPTMECFPEAMMWLGDFEKCIAWTWLQRIKAPVD